MNKTKHNKSDDKTKIEMLNHDSESDLWSLTIIVFIYICGCACSFTLVYRIDLVFIFQCHLLCIGLWIVKLWVERKATHFVFFSFILKNRYMDWKLIEITAAGALENLWNFQSQRNRDDHRMLEACNILASPCFRFNSMCYVATHFIVAFEKGHFNWILFISSCTHLGQFNNVRTKHHLYQFLFFSF